MSHKICIIEGCKKEQFCRKWCTTHYARWQKYGDPMMVKQKQIHGLSTEERFWEYVDKCGEDECWNWTGYLIMGYGALNIDGKMVSMHRFSYELHNGSIPEGLHIRHTCFNRLCVNPAHLKAGTNQDNMNDWDTTGDRKWNAIVPDCVQQDIVRRYRAGGVTQQQLADELAKFGWKIHRSTIGYWVTGKWRKQRRNNEK